jgi:TPP-dependent pyruvate/acetoin dehydrogenase alpha subunit
MTAKSKEHPPAPSAQNGFSLISNAKLLQIYLTMLQCSLIHDRVRILHKEGRIAGKAGFLAGYEAALVGVAIDLLPEDSVCAIPSDLIPLFIKGLPLKILFARLFGPGAPSSHAADRLRGATAAAMANKTNKNNRIVVVFSSLKSTSLRAWQAALKLASLQALPMIFVSLSTHAGTPAQQPETSRLSLKTKACNFPIITVDGSDAVAVYRVASESIAHARKGDGPTLIECLCTKAGDPLRNMENYLMRKGLFSEGMKWQAAARFNKKLEAAIKTAENHASPDEGA